ncbi:MAG: methylenetetrahydrofolate reductase [NAD(P)H] [Caldithrix sp.]|nr:methylenetetrahydrofolate reductase [NAD(P)H] [Caldithrix sp.]
MHITSIFDEHKTSFSFEFFPPKTEKGYNKLFRTIRDLKPLQPSSISVTYGAGGSTRKLTHDLVLKIHQETDLTVIPHLTCINAKKDEIYSLVKDYADNGIENIFVIRGDAPQGQEDGDHAVKDFRYAVDLVRFIKKHFPRMGMGVAGFPEGHPDTPNRLKEMEYLKEKIDAGADYMITQMCFDNRDFFDFRERCELMGIDVPIIAGIMPITSRKNMYRMSDLAAGSRFPAKLQRAIHRVDEDERVENVGVHWATSQVLELLDNEVNGIHFYTLNKSMATRRIYEALGTTNSRQLAI